jgi:hypothetical protein
MNDLDLLTFSSLRGSRPRPPVMLHTRSYGKARHAYTPRQTNLDPRTACRNDVEQIDADTLAVILQDGAFALVDKCEYERLREMGYLGRWNAKPVSGGNTYVGVNYGRSNKTIARLLLVANHTESVRYRDGNTLNLTRANLIVCTRGGNPLPHLGTRRCLPAPAISADERRDIAKRKSRRSADSAAEAAAARLW